MRLDIFRPVVDIIFVTICTFYSCPSLISAPKRMAGALAKDSDIQIFREDQVKINTFAKKNHKLQVFLSLWSRGNRETDIDCDWLTSLWPVWLNVLEPNYSLQQELKEELKARQKELQNLEDAETEIMMLDDEEGEAIPMQVWLCHHEMERRMFAVCIQFSMIQDFEINYFLGGRSFHASQHGCNILHARTSEGNRQRGYHQITSWHRNDSRSFEKLEGSALRKVRRQYQFGRGLIGWELQPAPFSPVCCCCWLCTVQDFRIYLFDLFTQKFFFRTSPNSVQHVQSHDKQSY